MSLSYDYHRIEIVIALWGYESHKTKNMNSGYQELIYFLVHIQSKKNFFVDILRLLLAPHRILQVVDIHVLRRISKKMFRYSGEKLRKYGQ